MKGREVTDQTPISNLPASEPRQAGTIEASQSQRMESNELVPSNLTLAKPRAESGFFSGLAILSSRESSKAPIEPRSSPRLRSQPTWIDSVPSYAFIWLRRRFNSMITAQMLSLMTMWAPYLVDFLRTAGPHCESPLCVLQRLTHPALPIRCGLGHPTTQSPVNGYVPLPFTFGSFDKLPAIIMIVASLVADIDRAVNIRVLSMDSSRDFKPLGKRLRLNAHSERRILQIDHMEQSIAAFSELFKPFAAEGKTLVSDCRVDLLGQIYYDISSHYKNLADLAKAQNESSHIPLHEWVCMSG